MERRRKYSKQPTSTTLEADKWTDRLTSNTKLTLLREVRLMRKEKRRSKEATNRAGDCLISSESMIEGTCSNEIGDILSVGDTWKWRNDFWDVCCTICRGYRVSYVAYERLSHRLTCLCTSRCPIYGSFCRVICGENETVSMLGILSSSFKILRTDDSSKNNHHHQGQCVRL